MDRSYLDVLTQSVLAPVLELDHSKIRNLALIENTFVNVFRVFTEPKTLQLLAEGNQGLLEQLKKTHGGFWDFFKRRYSLKNSLSARLKLCSFVCKREAICYTGEDCLDRRVKKVITLFTQQNLNTSGINMSQLKEPLEIIESLLIQAKHLLKRPDLR
jgi:hypothetical protein